MNKLWIHFLTALVIPFSRALIYAQESDTEFKFLKLFKMDTQPLNCLGNLKDIKGKVIKVEKEFLKVVQDIRSLMALIISLPSSGSRYCSSFSSSSNNEANITNSDNITNWDVFHFDVKNKPLSLGDDKNVSKTSVSAPTVSNEATTTAFRLQLPGCFDIISDLGGTSLEAFFPIGTSFPATNNREKCQSFCSLAGYSFALLNTLENSPGSGCFCFNTEIRPTKELFPAICNVPCPGNSRQTCGGKLPNITLILSTGRVSNPEEKFPSGFCYIGHINEASTTIDFITRTTLADNTPQNCSKFCREQNFSWSCTFNGNLCGCLDNQPLPLSPNQDICNVPCAGNSAEENFVCGGTLVTSRINCLSRS